MCVCVCVCVCVCGCVGVGWGGGKRETRKWENAIFVGHGKKEKNKQTSKVGSFSSVVFILS